MFQAELDKALKDIETERNLRKKAEINASETKLQYQQINDELNMMTNKYKTLIQQYNSGHKPQSTMFSNPVSNLTGTSSINFIQEKLISITEVPTYSFILFQIDFKFNCILNI